MPFLCCSYQGEAAGGSQSKTSICFSCMSFRPSVHLCGRLSSEFVRLSPLPLCYSPGCVCSLPPQALRCLPPCAPEFVSWLSCTCADMLSLRVRSHVRLRVHLFAYGRHVHTCRSHISRQGICKGKVIAAQTPGSTQSELLLSLPGSAASSDGPNL